MIQPTTSSPRRTPRLTRGSRRGSTWNGVSSSGYQEPASSLASSAARSSSRLFGYAVVQTLQPEDRYGRLFAAYAGVFLIGAMLWGWGIDGKEPDRFDWVGASIVLLGAAVILWGRRIFA